MAADPAVSALNSLLRSSSIDDHSEALRLANAAVRASKAGTADHATAQHSKVVALLKLDRFEDALRAIAEGGTALEAACHLERTYALYKTGALSEAEALLREEHQSAGDGRELSNTQRGIRHVAAQVSYRAERFERAAELYRSLAGVEDSGRYGEENDLKINLLATNAQLEWQGRGHAVPEAERRPAREDMEAFETGYNAGCGCAARGDYAKAAVLLKRAKDLCEASEELSDDEKRAELLPIVVQQAYVLVKMGKLKEAADLQGAIALSDLPDGATKVVAQSNAVLLRDTDNPFMKQRLLSSTPELAEGDQLFEFQAGLLSRNRSVIELQAQKFSGVKASAAKAKARNAASPLATDTASLGVLGAAAQARLQTGKEALHSILPLLDTRPDDIGLLLTLIQLYIQTKNPAPALALLEAFFKRLELATTPDDADVRHAPGLVALAVALYRLLGRHRSVRAELTRAAAHWQKQKKGRSEEGRGGGSDSLLRQAGVELLLQPSSTAADLAVAGASFEHLAAARPDDRVAAAGLVASFATSDPAKAEPHLASLTPVTRLTAGIDVAALIDGGVAVPSAPAAADAAAAAASKTRKRAAEAIGTGREAAPRRKRRRTTKLPKSYEEGKKPDPERWLPLRDRSSYRPKGRKGKKRAQEATQGGFVRDEAETLELAGGAGAVRVEKAPVGGTGAAAGGGAAATGGGGGAGGKKKKKGKK